MINSIENDAAWLGGWVVLGEIAQKFEGSRDSPTVNYGTLWVRVCQAELKTSAKRIFREINGTVCPIR